jgi:DNA-directed RNA polymerase specialized sigma24 family protein
MGKELCLIPQRVQNDDFTEFVKMAEPRLRVALCAAFGIETGREATAEALAFAWEHWDRVSQKDNPVGYLWGVGRHKVVGGPLGRRHPELPQVEAVRLPWVEPGLPAALAHLSESQRVTVILLYGFQWTHSEVAATLGVAKTTVQNHAVRGLAHLRKELGVGK